MANLLDDIKCPPRTGKCKFLLVGKNWCVHELESIEERRLWVRPYFFICSLDVWLKLQGWYSYCLWGAVARICSKYHAVFLCGSHLAFSPSVPSESKWCNHILVLTRLQLGRITVLFHQWSDPDVFLNLSIAVYDLIMPVFPSLSVDEILLPKNMNWSTNFRGLIFNE